MRLGVDTLLHNSVQYDRQARAEVLDLEGRVVTRWSRIGRDGALIDPPRA